MQKGVISRGKRLSRAERELNDSFNRERAARVEAEAERCKFQSLVNQAPIAICTMEGPDYTFSFANAALSSLIGGRELVGKRLLEALPELRGQGIDALLDGVMASGKTYFAHESLVRFDRTGTGQIEDGFFNVVYAPRRNPRDHRVDGVMVCAYEVTEHVRAREAAEAATAELEAILQSLPDALYVGKIDGILRANERALAMLGYDSVVELNRHVGVLAREIETRRADTGEVIPAHEQPFAHALAGQPDVQEVRVRHLKTGEERVLRSACAPVRVGGEVVAAVAINTDITEHKQIEKALRERVEFEEQLIGIVSHDLRNPLNAILLGVAGVLRREKLGERSIRALLRVQSSAERATRLVQDFLDFTQARQGEGIPVHPRPLELHGFARHVVEEVLANFPERDIRLEAEGDAQGAWDADRLAQVITNLVSNAIKYSPDGTPVTVRTLGKGARVVLEVHNQGEPIPVEAQGRLFRPLQRTSSQSRAAGRSVGLGLYIVKHVVEAHRGTVQVRSNADEGTTFTVSLPRTPAAATTD